MQRWRVQTVSSARAAKEERKKPRRRARPAERGAGATAAGEEGAAALAPGAAGTFVGSGSGWTLFAYHHVSPAAAKFPSAATRSELATPSSGSSSDGSAIAPSAAPAVL